MKPYNSQERKKKILQFLFINTATLVLGATIVSSFYNARNSRAEGVQSNPQSEVSVNQVEEADRFLHARLLTLLVSHQVNSSTQHNVNKTEMDIRDANLKAFRHDIDSLELIALQMNEPERKNLQNLLYSFKVSMEVPGSSKDQIIATLPAEEKITRQESIKMLTRELETKTERINQLEKQLKTFDVNNNFSSPKIINGKQMQEVEFLRWALRSQVVQNQTLASANKALKRDLQLVNNQINISHPRPGSDLR